MPDDGLVNLRGPFSLDEIDLIERLSGVPFPKWFDGETFEGALRKAIVFVHGQRSDPTYLNAGQAMTIDQDE